MSLVVVSNRLPVVFDHAEDSWQLRRGGGGLVRALDPVLRKRGGIWVGWPGVDAQHADGDWRDMLRAEGESRGYRFEPVMLEGDHIRDFYGGFANSVLWPLFHNLDDRCVFEPAYFHAYVAANERFARAIVTACEADDFVWVHDYHLICVAEKVRSLRPAQRLGFFLHIPFPPFDGFVKLPWRAEMLDALLAYDLLGFQSERDRRSFLECVRRLRPDIDVEEIEAANHHLVALQTGGQTTRVGTFPIGIDFASVARAAASDAVANRALSLRVDLRDRAVILGIDRLDYTKGIPERLLAFQQLLEQTPDLHERVVFVQVASPSRELVPEYVELKQRIDGLVGAINGRFGTPGWVPVHYLYRNIGHPDLQALYRLARVALVTPLKDGMNLVAKEYCACQLDEPGVLVLSEFAGAAAQLCDGAFVVNPYDVVGTARALREALQLSREEREARLSPLRRNVENEDVFWWTRRFLTAAEGTDIGAIDEYVPVLEASDEEAASPHAVRVIESHRGRIRNP